MAWYAAGTIAVTNGSAAVVGTGTSFVDNVKAGDALRGPDERLYQIASVNSSTSLTLARNYAGASAAGQAYEILSTQDALAVLAKNVALLIEDYQDIADNAGQGMFGFGSAATPGIRFADDQDTGFWRPSANVIAWATGGVERGRVEANGNHGFGVTAPAARLHALGSMILQGAGSAMNWWKDGTPTKGARVLFDNSVANGLEIGHFDGAAWRLSASFLPNGNVGIDTGSPQALFDLGGGAFGQKLLVYSAANTRYGFGIGDAQMRTFAASNGALTFGHISTADGATFTERMRIAASGDIGVGSSAPRARMDIHGDILLSWGDRFIGAQYDTTTSYQLGLRAIVSSRRTDIYAKSTENDAIITFSTGGGTESARIDAAGNLLVGAAGGSSHTIFKTLSAQTDKVLDIGYDNATPSMRVYGAYAGLGSSAHCAANFGHSSTTSRSINAGGTINASGADYAEYMVKAADCGTIAKGDVCGVDIDGKLTQSWAAACSFVIKSTDPSLVGGDSWANDLDPRPEPPTPIGNAPAAPIAPEPFTDPEPTQGEEESDAAFAVRLYIWGQAADAAAAAQEAYEGAMEAFPTSLAEWQTANNAYTLAQAQFEIVLSDWEEALEAARLKVDRIAFCGQVPVNLTGEFGVGDYVLPAEGDGGAIDAVAVPESAITFDQYRRRIGKVWAIREGRAWIDVQHG